jgi:ABC-type dipeptide/oligopeptide/nickel transport system permease subunit
MSMAWSSLWFVILIIAFFSWFDPGRIIRGGTQS